ncbi:hypothetical protein TNCV_1561411 [Trichonephila clavipes]|nr:hypothetical protein TNCV_1561411 [Trichonephila clavipes]
MLLEIFFILSDGRTRWGPRVSESPVEEWKMCSPILHTLLMLALLRECSCFFFSLFQDIMPSGLTVHRVLIAPRDSILQNVETVIQCSTWPLHHWRSPRGIQTHRFFISREIYCIGQLRLYGAEDCDVMLQWTVVLDLEFDDGRRDCLGYGCYCICCICIFMNEFLCVFFISSFVNLKEGRSDGRSPVPKVTTADCTLALFTGNGFKRNVGVPQVNGLYGGRSCILTQLVAQSEL